MEVACDIEHQLKLQQTKDALLAEESDFIEKYVADHLQDRIIQNNGAGMVLDAIGDETDAIMDAYSPALIEFHSADMRDTAELTKPQEQALLRLGWAMMKVCKKYNSDFSTDELTEEAEKEFRNE